MIRARSNLCVWGAALVCAAPLARAGYAEGAVAHGRGDYATAAKEFRIDKNNRDAQFALGTMHERGEGMKQDHNLAFHWYLKAATTGHMGAQFNLGLMYMQGRGKPRNIDEALRWYRASASQGYPPALVNLGAAYLDGLGMDRNAAAGLALLKLAALMKDPRATQAVERVTPRLSREDVARAEPLFLEMVQQVRRRGNVIAPVLLQAPPQPAPRRESDEWYPEEEPQLRSETGVRKQTECRWVPNTTLNPYEVGFPYWVPLGC